MNSTASGTANAERGPPTALDATSPDPLLQPLVGADQACKECWRRKAKCNRAIPTCALCVKYGRHCLYEKHSKTPLTRKHLTEVEERLERAERLLRRYRSKAAAAPSYGVGGGIDGGEISSWIEPPATKLRPTEPGQLSHPPQVTQDVTFDFNAFDAAQPLFSSDEIFGGAANFADYCTGPVHQDFFYLGIDDVSLSSGVHALIVVPDDEEHPSNTLDAPPVLSDDFEWNEQNTPGSDTPETDGSPLAPDSGGVENDVIIADGMASLTIDESEGGYLGVASGAALLRLIDPLAADQDGQSTKLPRIRQGRQSHSTNTAPVILFEQPSPDRHIADSMIDAYFRLFHMCYPLVHEPSFRAQYAQVIERPNGNCWSVLAYVMAAIGVFTSGTEANNLDFPLFAHAKSLMSINFLESGNLTTVQSLILMSNYLQKRNKPNSGYNYLGLAVRMAMGIGLHKEFQGWRISPLKMEIRRRVWWCLSVFENGSTYTFSRPLTWPREGVETSLPMNIHDRDLTVASTYYPQPTEDITLYTTLRVQASFHLASNPIYTRVISKPFPSASELLELDAQQLGPWYRSIPTFFEEGTKVPEQHSTAHAIMMWRYRNFKIIMYRPFVIRQMLYAKQGLQDPSPDARQASDVCLREARTTISSIWEYWNEREHSRLAAWYALYMIFQAALIPCICLRNDPASEAAGEWREQIISTLRFIKSIVTMNPTAPRCHDVISGLCRPFLCEETLQAPNEIPVAGPSIDSLQVQMNDVYGMIWPNVPALETDVVMQDEAWMEFLRSESGLFDVIEDEDEDGNA